MQNEENQLPEKDVGRPNVAGELLIPILGVLFTIYYISTVLDSPWTAQVNAYMVGTVLLLSSTLLFVVKGMALLKKEAKFEIPFSAFLGSLKSPQFFFILMILAYLVALELVGFVLASVLFFFSSMLFLDKGKAPAIKLVISIILASIGYLVFILMFETRLPKGVIETFLSGLIK